MGGAPSGPKPAREVRSRRISLKSRKTIWPEILAFVPNVEVEDAGWPRKPMTLVAETNR
jgi:hypothetical protein